MGKYAKEGPEVYLSLAGRYRYNDGMEISFAPELEAKLNQAASQAGKEAAQFVQDLVATYIDHDHWFRQEVQKGLDSMDRGKFVSHEEVRNQMDRILRS